MYLSIYLSHVSIYLSITGAPTVVFHIYMTLKNVYGDVDRRGRENSGFPGKVPLVDRCPSLTHEQKRAVHVYDLQNTVVPKIYMCGLSSAIN